MLVTLDRLRRPAGDKFVFSHLGGSADLWAIFRGALAITRHLDPYGPLPQELLDPSGWPAAYPPQTFTLFLPLVRATRGDFEAGSQAFYWINILATLCVSVAVGKLIQKLTAAPALGVFLSALVALALNPLAAFALDRGQSEMVTAALAWSGVYLFAVSRKYAWALTLLTLSSAIKGYTAPLTFGLLLTIPSRKEFLRALAGAVAVTAMLTLPALPYLASGARALSERISYFFIIEWFNHSFKAVFEQLIPNYSDTARKLTCAVTLLFAAVAGFRVGRSARASNAEALIVDVVLFAGLTCGLMVGLPVYSGPYNYVVVLPALLIAGVAYPSFVASTKLSAPSAALLGALCLLSLWGALQVRWIGSTLSMAGLGLLGHIFVASWLAIAPRRVPAAASVAVDSTARELPVADV